jgi:hypothetical protein
MASDWGSLPCRHRLAMPVGEGIAGAIELPTYELMADLCSDQPFLSGRVRFEVIERFEQAHMKIELNDFKVISRNICGFGEGRMS